MQNFMYQLLFYQQKTMRNYQNYQAKDLKEQFIGINITDNEVVEIATANEEKYIRELLDSSYQGVKRLFVLAYNNTAGNNQVSVDSYKKYFLPRVKIENYNIEIDGRNFYDQPINDSIKQYDKIRKISAGQGDDYTTGCLLDFSYFEKNYRLIAVDLSKKKSFRC